MQGGKRKITEFEQMLRRSRRILYNICFTFTDRHPENVNDLYQEIVASLWRAWPKYRGKSDFTTWVYRIALNTAGMEMRKHKQKDTIFIPFNENLRNKYTEEDSDPCLEELYLLIDQLDDDEKKLILLYLDRLTYSQIADIAKTNENAVKQKIYRIKQKLIQLHQQEKEER